MDRLSVSEAAGRVSVRSLPQLDVPVVMVQERQNQVAPGAAIQRYAHSLEVPRQPLVWFENSAHTPISRSLRNSGNSPCDVDPASPPRPEL
jgi:hypothetical protein